LKIKQLSELFKLLLNYIGAKNSSGCDNQQHSLDLIACFSVLTAWKMHLNVNLLETK